MCRRIGNGEWVVGPAPLIVDCTVNVAPVAVVAEVAETRENAEFISPAKPAAIVAAESVVL